LSNKLLHDTNQTKNCKHFFFLPRVVQEPVKRETQQKANRLINKNQIT